MTGGLVRVYRGLGSSDRSSFMLLKTLSQTLTGTPYTVRTISPAEIIRGCWEKEAVLLVIGGGYDRGFVEALGRQGVGRIRQYVHQGGSYLGICAGGYFACNYVQFDQGGPLEVCGTRDLRFYPGKCIGPVFPGFKYDSEDGAHAVNLQWSSPMANSATVSHDSTTFPHQPITREAGGTPLTTSHAHTITDQSDTETCHCYFNGGGYFSPDEPMMPARYQVLATYAELADTPPAVVQCCCRKGRVVLTGVHLEYNTQDLDERDERIRQILPSLRKGREACHKRFRDLLNRLGLDTQHDMKSYL